VHILPLPDVVLSTPAPNEAPANCDASWLVMSWHGSIAVGTPVAPATEMPGADVSLGAGVLTGAGVSVGAGVLTGAGVSVARVWSRPLPSRPRSCRLRPQTHEYECGGAAEPAGDMPADRLRNYLGAAAMGEGATHRSLHARSP